MMLDLVWSTVNVSDLSERGGSMRGDTVGLGTTRCKELETPDQNSVRRWRACSDSAYGICEEEHTGPDIIRTG